MERYLEFVCKSEEGFDVVKKDDALYMIVPISIKELANLSFILAVDTEDGVTEEEEYVICDADTNSIDDDIIYMLFPCRVNASILPNFVPAKNYEKVPDPKRIEKLLLELGFSKKYDDFPIMVKAIELRMTEPNASKSISTLYSELGKIYDLSENSVRSRLTNMLYLTKSDEVQFFLRNSRKVSQFIDYCVRILNEE